LLGGESGGVGSDEGHHIIIAVIAPPTATATAVKALTIFLIASAQASARCPTSSACIIPEYHTCKRTKNFFLLSYSLMANFRLSMCAGQQFKIKAIKRPYRKEAYHVLPKEPAFT
jgi:hypothetical protein